MPEGRTEVWNLLLLGSGLARRTCGGGYLSNDEETAGTTWDNSWDFPDVIDEETKKVKKVKKD